MDNRKGAKSLAKQVKQLHHVSKNEQIMIASRNVAKKINRNETKVIIL